MVRAYLGGWTVCSNAGALECTFCHQKVPKSAAVPFALKFEFSFLRFARENPNFYTRSLRRSGPAPGRGVQRLKSLEAMPTEQ